MCSLYGSILCIFCYKEIDKICKSWNVNICTLLNLPHNAYTMYLGSLINKLHLNEQLYIRDFRFYGMLLDRTTVFLKLV